MVKEIGRRDFLKLGGAAALVLATACAPSAPTVENKAIDKMLAGLGLTPAQVAQHPGEVNINTKAYLGPLLNYDDKGEIIPVFNKIGHLEHIYTDYPEGRVPTIDLGFAAALKEDLLQFLQRSRVRVSYYAEEIIRSEDFGLIEPFAVRLIKPHVRDFGFTAAATLSEIYARGEALGAYQCQTELGPYLRLRNLDQPVNDSYYIAMKGVIGSNGYPHAFSLGRRGDGRYYLSSDWTGPDALWGPATQFVFSLSSAASNTHLTSR